MCVFVCVNVDIFVIGASSFWEPKWFAFSLGIVTNANVTNYNFTNPEGRQGGTRSL